MNFKIESNYININNYPFMESHFEKKAREGWLISKIFQGYIFLYKRIKPEDLKFSISPYEMESFFNRKTKADLKEFQTVCKHVGWNYATKTLDFHIYFKEQSDETMPLETDEEELFKTLELIGKKQEKSSYLITVYTVFLSWFILRGIFKDTQALKDGLQLLLAALLPVMLILEIIQIIDINQFFSKNRENIESGLPLVFDNSKRFIYKILFSLINILFILFITHILYSGFILKNKIMFFASLPALIGITVGTLYRFIIKPKKMKLGMKILIFVIVIFLAIAISNFTGFYLLDSFLDRSVDSDHIENYRVLSVEDFEKKEDYNSFYENTSFLIPRSYDYYSSSRIDLSVETEYSKALSKSMAQSLMNRYLKEAKDTFINRTRNLLDYPLSSGDYDTILEIYGIGEEDFNNAKDKDRTTRRKELQEIGLSSSIIKANEDSWGVDEAYYLDYGRKTIVLRKDKEVFYIALDGVEFSSEIIQIMKNRLGF